MMLRFRNVLATGLLAVSYAAHAAGASSSFTSGVEDWLLSGDATTAIPSWIAAGGNPGGYIHGTDTVTGGVWYWQAPAAFLGDKSSSYGQDLSFDLRMRGSGPLFSTSDVVLSSGATTLHFDFANVPADLAWTHYSVVLAETAGWKVGSLAGAGASQAQLQSVLGNLTALRIRGEFITGADNGDLDNVVLAAVPEPETWALLVGGLALVSGLARRAPRRQRAGGRTTGKGGNPARISCP